ncbi:hypothetical protein VCHA54P489_90062 [Vibrio chagasii]|nr:hypothetical protein VCHA35O135_130112 [Vibrio chagasii]CAH6882334.1 hypothetical protein VCHA34P129_20295 [Vibrio chagasii]CAH6896711.1 hypothetical protein VCHA43P275_100172 [Vibrio chagasii]CAH6957203.1 hypothetical protein VCHA53O473_100172 [Vibrio chagasii]CAH7001134.1 hypothetical protein VCHA40P242_10224 [Vibrio chagasii]
MLIGEKTLTTKLNMTTLTTKADHYKSAERFGIQLNNLLGDDYDSRQ